ncbi:hypothetical protein D3C72_1939250 [compost metagenome]
MSFRDNWKVTTLPSGARQASSTASSRPSLSRYVAIGNVIPSKTKEGDLPVMNMTLPSGVILKFSGINGELSHSVSSLIQ